MVLTVRLKNNYSASISTHIKISRNFLSTLNSYGKHLMMSNFLILFIHNNGNHFHPGGQISVEKPGKILWAPLEKGRKWVEWMLNCTSTSLSGSNSMSLFLSDVMKWLWCWLHNVSVHLYDSPRMIYNRKLRELNKWHERKQSPSKAWSFHFADSHHQEKLSKLLNAEIPLRRGKTHYFFVICLWWYCDETKTLCVFEGRHGG